MKATVDAYDGTMHFYVVDPTDPIIQAYRKAFPDLFTDVEQDARRRCATHLRYPEDLFERADRAVRAVPHHRPASQFFHKARASGTSPDPDAAGDAATTVATAAQRGNNGGRNTTLATVGQPDRPAAT